MLRSKSRNNNDPTNSNLPKVLFTGHPDDCKKYFDEISKDILDAADCRIYYDDDPEYTNDMENISSILNGINLVVLVITKKYIDEKTFAHETVFRTAREINKPVLPFLMEKPDPNDTDNNGYAEFIDKLNRKLDNLQCIVPSSNDKTAIPYRIKLKNYLGSILLNNEQIVKMRSEFDAYIFLSYRKKDRISAQKLMKLIHSNDFCRDTAIWYDEFLMPGENFNDSIADALKKSRAFLLNVTPNLLENQNYIMNVEYPEAQRSETPIVPVMMSDTDIDLLRQNYKDLPEIMYPQKPELLTKTLRKILHGVKGENNDPLHIYLIGLAYLNGIDVEINAEKALKMITYAAEHNVTEAIGKLAVMYWAGDGVSQDLETAFHWQKKIAETAEITFKNDPTEDNALSWVSAVINSGYYIEKNGLSKELISQYDKALEIIKSLYGRYDPERLSECVKLIVDSYWGLSHKNAQHPSIVKKCFRKITAAQALLAEIKNNSDEMEELVYIYGNPSYNRFDDKTSITPEEYAEDAEFLRTGLEYTYQFAEKYPQRAASVLSSCMDHFYHSINYDAGDRLMKNGDTDGAAEYYLITLSAYEKISDNTKAIQAIGSSITGCIKLGNCFKTAGKLDTAREYYEKAVLICQEFVGRDGSRIKNFEPQNNSLKEEFKCYTEDLFEIMIQLAEIYYDLSLGVTVKQGFDALNTAANDARISLELYIDMVGAATEIYEKQYVYAMLLPRIERKYSYDRKKAADRMSECFNEMKGIALYNKCTYEITTLFSDILQNFQTADPKGLNAIFRRYFDSIADKLSDRCMKEAAECKTDDNRNTAAKKLAEECLNGFTEYLNDLLHKDN